MNIILIMSWIVTGLLLFIFVPKDKYRHAIIIFLFKQTITWILGLIVAHYKLIEYNGDIFSNATQASFTFEYIVYPGICVLFNLYYPENKRRFSQFLYYAYYCSAITIIEVFLEKTTNLINYRHWSGIMTWLSLALTFFVSRKFYLWFFKLKTKSPLIIR
ncbi:MAG: CBO0543 family protein [Bacillota bacterium]|nr:CBO0543 family protein [Bacillota bacterium]